MSPRRSELLHGIPAVAAAGLVTLTGAGLVVFGVAGISSSATQSQSEPTRQSTTSNVPPIQILLPASNRALYTSGRMTLLPPLVSADRFLRNVERQPSVPEPAPPPLAVPSEPPSPGEPNEADNPGEQPDPEGSDEGQEDGASVSASDIWFVGDSIIVGFKDSLGAAERQLTGWVGAGSGPVVDEALKRFSKGVQAPYMLVALGTNDSLGNEDIFSERAARLLDKAAEQGICVAWLTIHRVEGESDWRSYNAALYELARSRSNLAIVDWQGLAAAEPGLLYDDGVHIRPEGYRMLWKQAKKAFSSCTRP